MPIIFDDDILVHHVMVPGLDGDGFTLPEATALRADVDTLMSRPVITALTDIPDVDTAGVADGQTIIYDEGTGLFVPGSSGGTIRRVYQSGQPTADDVNTLNFVTGFAVTNPSRPDRADISVNFGGSGSANVAARRDHWHQVTEPITESFGPFGYMSGGTQVLATRNVTIPVGKQVNVVARLTPQLRGGDPGPCYYRLHLSVGGHTRSTPGGQNGWWCVQGVPAHPTWTHARLRTGTGTAIAVEASVSYFGGGGFYVDYGDLVIELEYDR